MIRYLSICAGIEAFSVASHGLGFAPAAFSEIDKFASAVLAHRFGSNLPGEPISGNAPPNIGDFTQLLDDAALRERLGRIDLLVGGTPCQAFSFAGKRLSLADARGNLTLAFAVLAHELARSHGCRNALWENVPGVLSTPDNAFGCFLGALVGADAPLDLPAGIGRWPDEGMVEGPGARAAWRLLDAQYFGLAQRRERVFVVVDLGGGADPAAVLFEPQGLRGNSPPRRETGQKPAQTITGGARSGGGYSLDDLPLVGEAYGGGNRSGAIDVAATLTAKGQKCDFEVETFIAHTLRGEGFDASEDGTGRGTPIVPVCIHADAVNRTGDSLTPSADSEGNVRLRPAGKGWIDDGTSFAVTTGAPHVVAFSCKDHGADAGEDIAPTLRAMGHGESHANAGGQVAIAYGITADALDRQGEGAGGTAAERSGLGISEELSPTLKATRPNAVAFSVSANANGFAWENEVFPTLQARAQSGSSNQFDGIREGWAVRRLTPTECARLQGFPDDHSRIPWRGKPAELCPDGPQYKTYGNSMAVSVMRWLAERIATNWGASA